MLLIGVDYHPNFQTIAFFEEETGECGERQLHLSDGEAGQFYRDLSDAEFACMWGWRLPLQVLGKGECSYRSWANEANQARHGGRCPQSEDRCGWGRRTDAI
jgi:hypothetical protein